MTLLLRRPSEQAVALWCALVAVLAGFAAMSAAADGLPSASGQVHIADSDAIAPLVRAQDPGFHFVTGAQHYDGTYYYATARDPFLLGRAHRLIDLAAYRYGHPLHGWLAGVISLGQARAVPMALLVLGLLGLGVGGWAVSRLAVASGRSAWGGLLVAFSPGLLVAATFDTTETVGAALVALLLLAWQRGAFRTAVLLSVAVCLDKEPYLVVPVGLGLWELLEAYRRRAWPSRVWTRTAAVVTGPVVLALWYGWVRLRLHEWPGEGKTGDLGLPGSGWRTAFRLARASQQSGFYESQIGSVDPTILVVTAAIVVVGVVAALRLRTVYAIPAILSAVILSLQQWPTLLLPHEVFRTPAVPVLLALAALLARPAQPGGSGPEATTSA